MSSQNVSHKRKKMLESIMKSTKRTQLNVEVLEGRSLMASNITASLVGGVLEVRGSDAADYIVVNEMSGKVSVQSAKISTPNGLKSSINLADVKQVKIWGFGENDTIQTSVNKPTTIWGGAGKDTIKGSDVADTIYGGDNEDKIWGNGGNDIIYGGNHDDFIDGGYDDDKLYGEGGNDNLKGYYGNDTLDGGADVDKFDVDLEDGYGFDTFKDVFDPYTPVVNGARADDIVQQDSYTCQTLGALSAAAKQGVNFASKISYLGNNIYRVKVYDTYVNVKFDGSWTDNDPMPANGQHESWTIIMQRARLNYLGISYNKEMSTDDWGAANKRVGGRLYDLYDALKAFTGWKTAGQYSSLINADSMAASLSRGDVLVAGTSLGGGSKKGGKDAADGIIGGHAYAVVGMYKLNGVWQVKLYNPYGRDVGKDSDRTIDVGTAKNDGYITLSWSNFVRSLQVVATAKRP